MTITLNPRAALRGIPVCLFLVVTGFTSANAQPQPRGYTSKVPHFKFSTVLGAQEAELRTNALLRRMNESRRKMANDPHHPKYDFTGPETGSTIPTAPSITKAKTILKED